MNTRPNQTGVRGFTLIELLVVIAIIATLAALLFPAVQLALTKARMAETMQNGKSIYQALMAANIDGLNVLPRTSGTRAFSTSTEYWKWAVSNAYVDAGFEMFGAHGLAPVKGLDEARFGADNNAWAITADLNGSERNVTPVLFSRNLKITSLADGMSGALTDEEPFGRRGVVVVNLGGAAFVAKPDELDAVVNPSHAGNRVLRP